MLECDLDSYQISGKLTEHLSPGNRYAIDEILKEVPDSRSRAEGLMNALGGSGEWRMIPLEPET